MFRSLETRVLLEMEYLKRTEERNQKKKKDIERVLTDVICSRAAMLPRLWSCPTNFVAQTSYGETVNEKQHGAPAENHQEKVKNLVQSMVSTRCTGEGDPKHVALGKTPVHHATKACLCRIIKWKTRHIRFYSCTISTTPTY